MTLRDLIERGYLVAGEKLICTPSKGAETYSASLGRDGSIRFKGGTYKTPSSWASALAGGQSRHGWAYVRRARDGRTLRSIHNEVLEKKTQSKDTQKHFHGGNQALDTSRESLRQTAPETELDYSTLLERIHKLSPSDFEKLVGEFLRAQGFGDIEVTGRTNDGGIDGHCSMPFVKIRVAFQAKRWEKNVPIEPVQRLVGSISDEFDRGILVTTSGYTPAARAWMDEKDRPIVLIDGKQFAQQLIALELGIKKVPLVRLEIDEEFFKSLS